MKAYLIIDYVFVPTSIDYDDVSKSIHECFLYCKEKSDLRASILQVVHQYIISKLNKNCNEEKHCFILLDHKASSNIEEVLNSEILLSFQKKICFEIKIPCKFEISEGLPYASHLLDLRKIPINLNDNLINSLNVGLDDFKKIVGRINYKNTNGNYDDLSRWVNENNFIKRKNSIINPEQCIKNAEREIHSIYNSFGFQKKSTISFFPTHYSNIAENIEVILNVLQSQSLKAEEKPAFISHYINTVKERKGFRFNEYEEFEKITDVLIKHFNHEKFKEFEENVRNYPLLK